MPSQIVSEVQSATVDLVLAGIRWRLRHFCDGLLMTLDSNVADFELPPDHAPDVLVDILWADRFDPPGDVVFDVGLWRTYNGEDYVFDFQTEVLGPVPYKRASFNRALTRGTVFLNRAVFKNRGSYYAFEYPLDELAMMHRLAQGHGVELHSCGMATSDGRGYLFVGHSGAGKSTTGKLWVAERNARILSDDRIIVTRAAQSFSIHGTPWHGEAGLQWNSSAELNAIFLIQHGRHNELVRLTPTQAAAELFARSFVPWYRPEALDFSLGFMQSIAESIPVYVFRCVPDVTAIEFLEAHCAI